jgi:hypothetical protein
MDPVLQQIHWVCPFAHSCSQLLQVKSEDELEAKLGFELFSEGEDRLGWLMTMSQVRRMDCPDDWLSTCHHLMPSAVMHGG